MNWARCAKQCLLLGALLLLFGLSLPAQVYGEIQTRYPAVAKIIGQGERTQTVEGESQAIYYGSGVYVAESGTVGIVLTNWHVVSSTTGLLDVCFPSFRSVGAVILADEVWDIAAIVIRKPPFVPIPISLEVPQIGEELWVAGYGRAPGLEQFQISSGPVLRYSYIDHTKYPGLKEPLPNEAIMIGTAVRFGDSGGPILNRYGELSGILWGSDGQLTMGTFCLRVQAFLTQTQFQLAHLPQSVNTFFEQAIKGHIQVKKIAVASPPAQKALAQSGVFPISSVPVYTEPRPAQVLRALPSYYKPVTTTDIQEEMGNGLKEGESDLNASFVSRRNSYLTAHLNGFTLPPYPPIESPTLLAQRKTIGRNHPEVYPDGTDRPLVAVDSTEDGTVPMVRTGADAGSFQNVSLETDVPPPQSLNAEPPAQTSPTAGEKVPLCKKIPFLAKMQLSDLETIFLIAVILFFFINSLRLLSIAVERPGKKAKGDEGNEKGKENEKATK